jgi:hypothetical protein
MGFVHTGTGRTASIDKKHKHEQLTDKFIFSQLPSVETFQQESGTPSDLNTINVSTKEIPASMNIKLPERTNGSGGLFSDPSAKIRSTPPKEQQKKSEKVNNKVKGMNMENPELDFSPARGFDKTAESGVEFPIEEYFQKTIEAVDSKSTSSTDTQDWRTENSENSEDSERDLFEKARQFLSPSAFYRVIVYLYAERKLMVFFWIHFVGTMVVWGK